MASTSRFPSYDLCPDVTVDQIIGQMRMASRELARLGRPLVVSGHSAGGHLAACMLATDWPAFDASLPADLGHCGLHHFRPVRSGAAGRYLASTRRCISTRSRRGPPARCSGRRRRAAVSMRWSAATKARNISGRAKPSSTSGARPASRRGSARFPDANHFTAIAPLADPASPMVSRLQELAARYRFRKKYWTARIWALARNYFKYKMIADRALPDALDVLSLSSRNEGRGAMEMSVEFPVQFKP